MFFQKHYLPLLANYFKNPKASTDSDIELVKELKSYDLCDDKNYIYQLDLGTKFSIYNGKIFKLEEKLRKRYKCLEIETGKYYLFNANSEINLILLIMSKTIAVSGYFDPIHVGHLDYLEMSKKLGDKLVVIVNNNNQCVLKKGKPFMDEHDRVRIVAALDIVDEVFLSIDTDKTVCKSLEAIKPDVFRKRRR